MTRAALGLGANLGDPVAALRGAVAVLGATPGIDVVAVSSLYRTAPVGGPPGQPQFSNAVVVVESSLTPGELLAVAHMAEERWHRTREVRWGPRTLDVDVLAVAGVASDDPVLTLPHPRAHERAFVLVPWAEIDPGFPLRAGRTVAEWRDALPAADLTEVVQVPGGSAWSDDEEGGS